MTPSELSAIRERLDAATPGPWELWYGELDWVSVGIDGDTVAECRTHINQQFSGWQNLRNATFIQHAPTDLRALLDEVERLRADPLPAAAWVREVERAAFKRGAEKMQDELAGWADRAYAKALTSDNIRMLPHASPAPDLDPTGDRAFDALQPSLGTPVPPERRIRRQADVDAAFTRGAEAMRTALLQRVSWGSDLADHIRAEPVPEDK
jgi:hypothetical protein